MPSLKSTSAEKLGSLLKLVERWVRADLLAEF